MNAVIHWMLVMKIYNVLSWESYWFNRFPVIFKWAAIGMSVCLKREFLWDYQIIQDEKTFRRSNNNWKFRNSTLFILFFLTMQICLHIFFLFVHFKLFESIEFEWDNSNLKKWKIFESLTCTKISTVDSCGQKNHFFLCHFFKFSPVDKIQAIENP